MASGPGSTGNPMSGLNIGGPLSQMAQMQQNQTQQLIAGSGGVTQHMQHNIGHHPSQMSSTCGPMPGQMANSYTSATTAAQAQQPLHMSSSQHHPSSQQPHMTGNPQNQGAGMNIQSQQQPTPQHQQVSGQGSVPQQQQQQTNQPHPPGHHSNAPNQNQIDQSKLDNISKAKALLGPMKDSLSNVMKAANQCLTINSAIDSGLKPPEVDVPARFDKQLEEFFSLCDQMELNLKTSIECYNQGMNSQRYLPTPVAPVKSENGLTYHQYINVVKNQIAYTKEIHATLSEASQKLSD